MQVRLTNTLTHLASVVEVFAAGSDEPAATAHTVNLAQLPTARMLSGCTIGTLQPEAAQRALVVRSATQRNDWALLIGAPASPAVTPASASTPHLPCCRSLSRDQCARVGNSLSELRDLASEIAAEHGLRAQGSRRLCPGCGNCGP